MNYWYMMILVVVLWISALLTLFWKRENIKKNIYRYARLVISLVCMGTITAMVALSPVYVGVNYRSYEYIYGIAICGAVEVYIIQRIYRLWREMHPLTLD